MPNAPTEVRSLARLWTKAAVETLGGIATNGETEAARVSAAVALLNRGWGMPESKQEHTGEDGGDIKITIRNIMEGKV